jgi:hypothetical protein
MKNAILSLLKRAWFRLFKFHKSCPPPLVVEGGTAKVLIQEQNLDLEPSGSLLIHSTELIQESFNNFTLIAQVSGSPESLKTLETSLNIKSEQSLLALKENEEVDVEVSLVSKLQLLSENGYYEVSFTCGNMVNAVPLGGKGEHYQFLLPYANFGLGDCFTSKKTENQSSRQLDTIGLEIEGVEWKLRALFEIDNAFYTCNQAYDFLEKNGRPFHSLVRSGHSVLEVSIDIGEEVAKEVAGDICWLLHLALAEPISWTEMKIIDGSKSLFLYQRHSVIPRRFPVNPPLSNGHQKRLKFYLENAFPIFKQNPDWWSTTLNWFTISRENPSVEANLVINFILLDRISTQILKGKDWGCIIGEDLKTALDTPNIRSFFEKRLTSYFQRIEKGWDKERTASLVNQAERWNTEPSYPRKIETGFELASLKPPTKQEMKEIQKRHKLLHEGKLSGEVDLILETRHTINRLILILLFSMLKYDGEFFAVGHKNLKMKNFKNS